MTEDCKDKDKVQLTRCELKAAFAVGQRPTEDDFCALIDSFIHQMDDGIIVSNEKDGGITIKDDVWIGGNLHVGENDCMDAELCVHGEVKAEVYKGDGSHLTGIEAGKWDETDNDTIFYNKGKVGIGTDKPDAELTVVGYIQSTEGFKFPDQSVLKSTEGLGFWKLHHGHMYTDNCHVGIGLQHPETALHVEGDFKLSKENSESHIAFSRNSENSAGAAIGFIFRSDDMQHLNDAGDLRFFTRKAGVDNDLEEHLRITDFGNIGIGTINPGSKLTVNGYIETTAGLRFPDGTVQTTAGGGSGSVQSVWLRQPENKENIFYPQGKVGIGNETPRAQLSVGMNPRNPHTEGEIQMILGGKLNTGANKNKEGDAFKLLISGYDNDGSTVYPLFLSDENNNIDGWIKNRPTLDGLPTFYFAGRTGIGTKRPEEMLHVNGNVRISGNLQVDGHLHTGHWHTPVHGDNVTDFGNGSTALCCYLEDSGRVNLEGRVTVSADTTTLFTLEPHHCPSETHIYPAVASTGYTTIEINVNGDVNVTGGLPAGENISLDGISFILKNPTTTPSGTESNTPN